MTVESDRSRPGVNNWIGNLWHGCRKTRLFGSTSPVHDALSWELVKPITAIPTGGVVEIEIPSRVDLVAVVRMVVAAATNAVEALSGDRIDDLRWVTSEAITNAIEANLSKNASGRVVVTCEVEDGMVRLAVKDQGPGMSGPVEVPDMTHPDRLHIEGAFGVPLMERLSSAVTFTSAESGTTVQMELHQ